VNTDTGQIWLMGIVAICGAVLGVGVGFHLRATTSAAPDLDVALIDAAPDPPRAEPGPVCVFSICDAPATFVFPVAYGAPIAVCDEHAHLVREAAEELPA
jgi:hypothetical protein